MEIATLDLSTLTQIFFKERIILLTLMETQTDAEIEQCKSVASIYNNINNAFVFFPWVRAEDPDTDVLP
jgi:hypothetical protein